MRVLLIGAGRYGNDLIGRKYMSGELGVKLAGIVDPKIDEIKNAANFCMHNIPTYHSIYDVPSKLVRECINELAIVPEIIPQVYGVLGDKGAKKVILPKPVATSYKDYREIMDITEKNNIQALVSSNWHYSAITDYTKNLLDKLTNKVSNRSVNDKNFHNKLSELDSNFYIDKVSVEYNKKDEVLTIDPPIQELPHALQIVYSTGLTDLKKIKLIMQKFMQSKSRVNVSLKNVNGINDGISLNSDLQMGDKLKDRRERSLNIFLHNDDGVKARIFADYDARFENGICKKPPSLSYECTYGDKKEHWEQIINEDNMNVMYEAILGAFKGYEGEGLTLKLYKPIVEVLSKVQETWENIVRRG